MLRQTWTSMAVHPRGAPTYCEQSEQFGFICLRPRRRGGLNVRFMEARA